MSSEKNGNSGATSQKDLKDLSNFVPLRLLSENSQRKTLCALGTFGNRGEQAVVFLEKSPLNESALKDLCSEKSVLENIFLNDIYGSYICRPDAKVNGIKTTIIYPAEEQHIAKYEEKPVHIINETPDLYKSVTLPYVLEEQLSLQWLYNILEHKKEADRIVFEDEDKESGFILVPDLKWDGTTIENLHLIALPHKRDLKSLRDLTAQHLPLLNNILQQGTRAISERYGIPSDKLRIYLHYQPTFYHLHVHFTNLAYEAPGINVAKAHPLITVINNLELVSDYYRKVTIPFLLSEGHGLFSAFESHGVVNRETKK